MSSNRHAKNELIRIYGPKCFIEELGIRTPEEIEKERKRYTSKKQRKIMDELTFHHIVEKCKNGRATVENGALLRNLNHQWFNRQSKERQEEINKMFQEYKKNKFKMRIAKVTTEEITPVAEIDLSESEEYIEIPLEPMTEEELRMYEEYKRKRNEKVFDKFGYEKPKTRYITPEQRRQQRELMEDLMLEIRY